MRKIDLDLLRSWLEWDFGGPAVLGFAVLLYFRPGLAFLIFLALAVVFIPILITALYRGRRYGWLFFFFVFVVVPGLLFYYMSTDSQLAGFVLLGKSITIGLFVMYCYLLRVSLPAMQDP
ncbi:MAG: hypothetical protein R6U28_07875 [Cyclonatronaceae bacterium]